MAVDIIGVTLILDNKKIEMHMNFEVNNLSTIFSFCAIFSLFPFFKYKLYIYIYYIYFDVSAAHASGVRCESWFYPLKKHVIVKRKRKLEK